MIEIKGLHKAFGQNQVLKGVDITVNKGDVVVVIGPSGSGKRLPCCGALIFWKELMPERSQWEILQ